MHIISLVGFPDLSCIRVILKSQRHCLIPLPHIKILDMFLCQRSAVQLYGKLPGALAYGQLQPGRANVDKQLVLTHLKFPERREIKYRIASDIRAAKREHLNPVNVF